MAQSRVERTGSIFNRVTGLLRGGVLKWDERPIWYDIYASHPPTQQPVWNRKSTVDTTLPVRPIFYAEDVVRAYFYKTFANESAVDLRAVASSSTGKPSVVEAFVRKYMRLSGEDNAKLVSNGVDESIVQQCADDVEQAIGVRLVTTAQLMEERSRQNALRSEKYTHVQSKNRLTKDQQSKMLGLAMTSFEAEK